MSFVCEDLPVLAPTTSKLPSNTSTKSLYRKIDSLPWLLFNFRDVRCQSWGPSQLPTIHPHDLFPKTAFSIQPSTPKQPPPFWITLFFTKLTHSLTSLNNCGYNKKKITDSWIMIYCCVFSCQNCKKIYFFFAITIATIFHSTWQQSFTKRTPINHGSRRNFETKNPTALLGRATSSPRRL